MLDITEFTHLKKIEIRCSLCSRNSKCCRINSLREGSNGDFSLVFSTSLVTDADATEKLRITSDGDVGIGTDNPSQLLHLAADSAHSILLKRSGAAPSECKFSNSGNLLTISNNVNGIHFDVGSSSFRNFAAIY